MIDFAGKIITTENPNESERLLRMAVSQGYTLPRGLKAMATENIFRFTGSPYKTVSVPDEECRGLRLRYADIFGDEDEELKSITATAVRWCMAHGYSHVSINANDANTKYTGKAFVSGKNRSVKSLDIEIIKPRKVTIEEIEKMFGYPVEVVS